MSDGNHGGHTWPGFKQSLEGPPPGHQNSQVPKDGTYVPLYKQEAALSAVRRAEKDPLEKS